MVRGAGGGCEYCPEYQRAVNGACVAESCGATERLHWDGTCKPCPSYARAQDYTIKKENQDGTSTIETVKGIRCGADACDFSKNEVLQVDGTCRACQAYTQAQADGITCTSPTCAHNEEL